MKEEDYATISKSVFRVIEYGTRSIVLGYLKRLSNDFNKPLDEVIDDFNESTDYLWWDNLLDEDVT